MTGFERDFPYCLDGERFSVAQAAVVVAGCGLGFAALLALPGLLPGLPGLCLGAALFPLAPLAGLALAKRLTWRAIFRQLTRRDVTVALVFIPPTFILPGLIAYAVLGRGLTSANPMAEALPHMAPGQLAFFLACTIPQLLGEELVTLLPFLVLLSGLHGRVPQPVAVALSCLVTALIFGALHLPTYGWQVFNALVIIGVARISLTACYIVTKNLWASFLTHLVNDWFLFGVVLGLSALKP